MAINCCKKYIMIYIMVKDQQGPSLDQVRTCLDPFKWVCSICLKIEFWCLIGIGYITVMVILALDIYPNKVK